MKILIADDDAITRKLIDASLTKAGHEVRAFEDGEALWEAYEEDPTKLVVTDWMMPRASGVEVCRRIRRLKSVDHAHVVLVTSLSPAEHTLEAYRAGVDDSSAVSSISLRWPTARTTRAPGSWRASSKSSASCVTRRNG